ncbi:Bacteroides conjugation system ATPase, TraG family [Catalinimonas alkaloidigena]|uniref:Bacteroides conjugation system ATPase, TraG family n=1 Tax=Catalinimonas alkaloidigena TaxID=1075417 RepID=A0A1G9U2T8_9BACT|nr:TraG family conjugative transposon ATPase [Catalinimonas alkaloidigena]SDM54226.1 Bacteroides conjugation system ATPase, TraG family [Catalinimonas alkaloidigena]
MAKAKTFELPYIGFSRDPIPLVFTQNADYSVVIRIQNPVLQYAADQSQYLGFHKLLQLIAKGLGSGYTLHKQDVIVRKQFRTEAFTAQQDFLSQAHERHFQGRIYTEITTYLTLTRQAKRGVFFTYDERQYKQFILDVQKVVEQLKARKMQPVMLEERDVKHHLKRLLAGNFADEHFSLSNFDCSDEAISLGNAQMKIVSLVDIDEVNLPGTLTPFSEMDELGYPFPMDLLTFLLKVPGEVVIYNQYLLIPEQHKTLKGLEAKKKRHESFPGPENETCIRDINAMLQDVASMGQLAVYAHFNILIKDDPEQIHRSVNYLEGELFNIGIIPSKNAYNQLELFRAMLPGNAGELQSYDLFLTSLDAALCFFFKERLPSHEASSFQVYFSDRQGIPVAIDTLDRPMETGRINNRNMFVLGPSGSGKSFFTNHLIRQYFLYDMDIVLVDTGHSYQGLCSYYGGRYITYEEGRPITMNPFRVMPEEYNEEKREFLKSLIGLLWKGTEGQLTTIEDTVISSVIARYYTRYFKAERPDPSGLSFNSFYEFSLREIESIRLSEQIPFNLDEYRYILKKFYRGGEYDQILNNAFDTSLFEEKFIVFEIDAIKEHRLLFPITTIIIMDVFIQKMRHKTNRKALIIEEAWKAIASPMMAGYILYLYKTVRKFFGLAAVVTQELDDIIGNPIVKDSIINNSDTIALLDQTKFRDNYDAVSRLLSISEVEQKKIFTINQLTNKEGRGRFKEVYIRRGKSGEVYGVEVSLFEYLTFTTERREKELVMQYVRHYGSYRIGLQTLIADLEQAQVSLAEFIGVVQRALVFFAPAETALTAFLAQQAPTGTSVYHHAQEVVHHRGAASSPDAATRMAI